MENRISDQPVEYLKYQDKKITLIGTAHVSKESTEVVERIIKEEKPDTVCVELCESRYQTLSQKDRWENMDIVKVIKEKKAFLLLANLLLSSFQRRVAAKLDVKPGQEMIQAVQTAKEVGAHIHLADRDVRITLSRTWRSMGLWQKIKILFQLLISAGEDVDIKEEDIEKMKREDMLESVLSEVGKTMPAVRDTLVDERDKYLSQKIKTAPGKTITAVVGAGHLAGIKKYFNCEIDIKNLETLPPKSSVTTFIKWFFPLGVLAILFAGFFLKGVDTGGKMLAAWILANGLFAAIGASAALAHPFTILTSFLAAPLTSLNPMIAAGWVSGLTESFARKPKVRDFQNLTEDILSIKGFWKNKVSRILLVVLFTNLGSSVGTFTAIPLMMKLL